MNLVIDNDVKVVLEFMQANLSANRLVSVAAGVNALAPVLWRQYETEDITILSLVSLPINVGRAEHIQPDAKLPAPEPAYADGGFGAGAS